LSAVADFPLASKATTVSFFNHRRRLIWRFPRWVAVRSRVGGLAPGSGAFQIPDAFGPRRLSAFLRQPSDILLPPTLSFILMTPNHTRLAIIGLVTLGLLATATAPAAAQTDTNPVEELFDDTDDEDSSFVDDPVGFLLDTDNFVGLATGVSERVSYQVSSAASWGESTDSGLNKDRNATIETINSNSRTLAGYISNYTTLSESQTHAVRLSDGDTQATFYVHLAHNATSERFESVTATVAQPANTTIDEQHLIKAQLAENLDAKAETFINEYAATDTFVLDDGRYVSRVASQYGGIGSNIESTLIHDDYDGFGGGESE